jgi:hypothetical protein
MAPRAYALAAIWSHADRILDLAIGLEPDSLLRTLNNNEPEVAGIDLLGLQPGPPDVAWPAWMSSAALLHHGLAAVFGPEDPQPLLGDALIERLSEAQLIRSAGIVAPEAKLLLRRDDWPDAMGTFLAGSAMGFDSGPFDRTGTRTSLVDGALNAIEANPGNSGAWLQLGAFGSGGFDPPAYERLVALVSADPARLVRLVVAGADPTLWRAILQPIAWRDVTQALHLAREVALACHRWHEGHAFDAESPIAPHAAAEELVELAAIIAACAGNSGPQTFADLLQGYARAWPELRPILHQTVGNLIARTPSGRADELWTLLNRLGSR